MCLPKAFEPFRTAWGCGCTPHLLRWRDVYLHKAGCHQAETLPAARGGSTEHEVLPSVSCGGRQPCPMAVMAAQRHWHRVVAPDPRASRHQW